MLRNDLGLVVTQFEIFHAKTLRFMHKPQRILATYVFTLCDFA